MTQQATRPVHLIGRAAYKNNLVLYRVTGSEHPYHDVTWDGEKVTACVTSDGPCQSFYYRHTCSHSRFVRDQEEARMQAEMEQDERRHIAPLNGDRAVRREQGIPMR